MWRALCETRNLLRKHKQHDGQPPKLTALGVEAFRNGYCDNPRQGENVIL